MRSRTVSSRAVSISIGDMSTTKPDTVTTSGIPVRPSYAPGDVPQAWDPGVPGAFPYTRGAMVGGYRKKLWTMRQYAGFSTARESNARYRYLLSQGQTGLSVAFDLPTQIGFDSDAALARGEVGRVGVAIDSIEDMETLLDGIPLGEVSISMTINATASILLGFLLAVATRRLYRIAKNTASQRRHRQIWTLPDPETAPRLGGSFCGGSGAWGSWK